MWSIYDTFMLVTGVIVVVIAVLPVAGIPTATRLRSGAIGGGLIILSLFLGSLRSFTYPSMVMVGPIIALLVLGAVIADARKRTNPSQAGMPSDQTASGALPSGAPASVPPESPRSDSQPVGAVAQTQPEALSAGPTELVVQPMFAEVEGSRAERDAAWLEVNESGTPPGRLAEIAGKYPEFGAQMLAHPNLYPALRDWIQNLPI